MVHHIEGDGRHFRDVIQSLGINNPVRNAGYMIDGKSPELLPRLTDALNTHPDLSDAAYYLSNVRDANNKFDYLSAPAELRRFVPEIEDIPGPPPEGFTFLVSVEHAEGDMETVHVVASNLDSAERIASRQLRELGSMRRDFTIFGMPVPLKDFEQSVIDTIMEGKYVSSRVLRYGGWREFAEKVEQAREASK